MLAVLSARFTDEPQAWARAPAVFMGPGGILLVVFDSPVREVLAWVCPPAMLVLAVWMIIKVKRQLRSRSGRVLIYPAIALLILALLGAG